MAPTVPAKKKRDFDQRNSLPLSARVGKSCSFPKKQTILAQEDAADAVFYTQKGKVSLTVVSKIGKEATIGILSDGDSFGESWRLLYVRALAIVVILLMCGAASFKYSVMTCEEIVDLLWTDEIQPRSQVLTTLVLQHTIGFQPGGIL
jgi:CRP/FNR family transcriptional regulator, cyclic AMP receptor protein